ncbi:MAG: lysophospholipid acyltransferase family protein [Paracoccaceae bacterium]
MFTWDDDTAPPDMPIGVMGALRMVARGVPMASVVFGGLLVLLLVRMVERPLCGLRRPVTPHITVGVCRVALWILGLRVVARGTPLRQGGAMVCNHVSWLDIFVLNSRRTLYFVSKSEVASWPGIGWLARATGTMFVKRDPREARTQTVQLEDRLLAGHRVLFFPEGTSTDGRRVLPFRTTLFAAFFSDRLRHATCVQAVSMIYHAPRGADLRFYGWWGEQSFERHLLGVLAARRHGHVELIYHPPEQVDAFPNRKSLARHMEAQVRDAHSLLGSAP